MPYSLLWFTIIIIYYCWFYITITITITITISIVIVDETEENVKLSRKEMKKRKKKVGHALIMHVMAGEKLLHVIQVPFQVPQVVPLMGVASSYIILFYTVIYTLR